jgi:PhzF family phenazine biosynthesis protein
MSPIPIYQVDAFTDHLFGGNPAAVCNLENDWLPDDLMQKIAAENNLAETAFLVPRNGEYLIRWFTPAVEVELCGHATLASAWVVFNKTGHPSDEIIFRSRFRGILKVRKNGTLLVLDFPSEPPEVAAVPAGLAESLGIKPRECFKGKTDYLVVLGSEEEVLSVKPDFRKLAQVPCRGVIVTAKGNEVDFVSRFFGPQVGIDEDPVTGSAHTVLTPFWSARLNKKEMTALQLSKRQGKLSVTDMGERTLIAGEGKLYMEGTLSISKNK